MSLQAKYADVLALSQELKIQEVEYSEENGKLTLRGTVEYQYEKDLIWDKIKTHAGWETEIAADLRIQHTDVYGYHVVKAGDSLSKIAKSVYDDPSQYMKIFEANRDVLKDPNVIHPGQRLKIPNKG